MTNVKLPDGSVREYDGAVTVKAVAKSIGSRLAKDALWGEVDQQPVSVDYEIPDGSSVDLTIITKQNPDALATICLLYTSPSPRD